jgi:hypothetical protein
MKESTLNKIIEIIRSLNEDGMASFPTNNTASTPGKPGFSELSPAGGPTAGISPKLGDIKRRKKIIGLGKNSRNRWRPNQ